MGLTGLAVKANGGYAGYAGFMDDFWFELNSAFILARAHVNVPELNGVWLFHHFLPNIIALQLHWISGTRFGFCQ